MKPFERTLKLGDEGEDVYQLQQRLIDLGFNHCKFDDGSIGEIVAEGYFGDVTSKCLSDLQRKCQDKITEANLVGYDIVHAVPLGECDYNTWFVLKQFELFSSYYRIMILPDEYEAVIEDVPPLYAGEPEFKEVISKAQIKAILKCSDATVEKHYEALNKTLEDYKINTPLRIQHFMAQIGHESCGLRYTEEIASGKAYEGRADLGNIYEGDGRKFKGRSPLQLTGRANYTEYFRFIGRPELIETPEILSTDMELMWGATAWYWKTRNLNKWCDRDDIMGVTLRVNGGYNGLADRKQYLARANAVIKLAA